MKPPICKVPAAAAALFLGTTGAQASVTLILGNGTSHLASNWGDINGTGTSLMAWGILVDTTGNGFLASFGGYSGQGSSLTAGGAQTLLQNGTFQPSDDVLFMSPALMVPVTNTSDSGVVGQNRITAITTVPLANGVGTGDHFAVVWFDMSQSGSSLQGRHFGIFENAAYTLPPDGNNTDYTIVFAGPDPLKPMNGLFDVPEPSTLLLSALGALGLIRRRR